MYITDVEEARQLGGNCSVVEGDVVVHGDLSGELNLDGLEAVRGSLRFQRFEFGLGEGLGVGLGYNLSSSTLKVINGSLDIYSSSDIQSIILPALNFVNRSVFVTGKNLTYLDLTNLEYVGNILFSTPLLKTLKMDGLKDFTGYLNFTQSRIFTFSSVGEVESLDPFFKYPIEPLTLDGSRSGVYDIELDYESTPRVKEITFGWNWMHGIIIKDKDLSITFGGPETSSMEIDSLQARGGSINITRSTGLDSLKVGELILQGASSLDEPRPRTRPDMSPLELPFDELTMLHIFGVGELRSIELPPEAENWKNVSLEINDCSNLNMTSEQNAQGETAWYWPRHDMDLLSIYGNMTDEFL